VAGGYPQLGLVETADLKLKANVLPELTSRP